MELEEQKGLNGEHFFQITQHVGITYCSGGLTAACVKAEVSKAVIAESGFTCRIPQSQLA